MRLNVVLGSMLGVFVGVDMMTVSQVRVVTGLNVAPSFMVFCGFAVMARSELMVLRCLGVMMCSFFRHRGNLSGVLLALEDYGESSMRRGYRNANSM